MLDQNQDERMSLPNEFEAVVLAGMGSKMYPLTEDIPKALLPIANQPLISNALVFRSWLIEEISREIQLIFIASLYLLFSSVKTANRFVY